MRFSSIFFFCLLRRNECIKDKNIRSQARMENIPGKTNALQAAGFYYNVLSRLCVDTYVFATCHMSGQWAAMQTQSTHMLMHEYAK